MLRVIPVVVLIICLGIEQRRILWHTEHIFCVHKHRALHRKITVRMYCSKSTCCAVLPPASAGPLLTTSNGVIYDANGNPVKLKGIGWFGFNTA